MGYCKSTTQNCIKFTSGNGIITVNQKIPPVMAVCGPHCLNPRTWSFCWHADAFRNSVFNPCLTAMSIAIDITVFQSRQPEIKTCLILVVNIPSITNLVGGLEHEFYDFPFSWEVHHHWRTPSFFRGAGSTTNQKWLELVKQGYGAVSDPG